MRDDWTAATPDRRDNYFLGKLKRRGFAYNGSADSQPINYKGLGNHPLAYGKCSYPFSTASIDGNGSEY